MRETIARIDGTWNRQRFSRSIVLRDGIVVVAHQETGDLIGLTLGEVGAISRERGWRLSVVHEYQT